MGATYVNIEVLKCGLSGCRKIRRPAVFTGRWKIIKDSRKNIDLYIEESKLGWVHENSIIITEEYINECSN